MPSSLNVLLFLVAFRLLNALCVRTFFQPDEFFQSLEPAWQLAFGSDRGAWITWEWKHQLRSSLHPLLFAAVYHATDLAATILHLPSVTRADLLIAAPKTTQAVVAALGDYYTWKLARRVYASHSREALAALALTVVSPWQWFCSTRTFSNCLETTLTVAALYLWPWQWSLSSSGGRESGKNAPSMRSDRDKEGVDSSGLLTRLCLSLCLAALACVLRPTNALIWVTLASFALLRSTWSIRKILLREALISGSAILSLSALADRLFYGTWTFPPLNFIYFNIAQSLAIFYGINDWHYYLSQGYPLLLTTALPFAAVGLYRALVATSSSATGRLRRCITSQLATLCLVMPFALSLIAHKEVRFIYPLLPCLHVLASSPLVDVFYPAVTGSSHEYIPRRLTLLFLLLANAAIALYTTLYHESGPLNVLSYLRDQYRVHSASSNPDIADPASRRQSGITAGFLMPCHSTPWRSHLVYPTIDAWALTCEPPIYLNTTQKASYLDEADQFYANPSDFLRDHMVGGLEHIPRKPSYSSPEKPEKEMRENGEGEKNPTHIWPDYLIFFAQLEPTVQSLLRTSSYAECWRTFNTAWHHDWRRQGDVVVWCLDPLEQKSWRENRNQNWKTETETETRHRQFEEIIEAIKREATMSNHYPRRKFGLPSFRWPSGRRRQNGQMQQRYWPSDWIRSEWNWNVRPRTPASMWSSWKWSPSFGYRRKSKYKGNGGSGRGRW